MSPATLEDTAIETLAQRIAREGPLPWREAATVLADVCDALAALHARGEVHGRVDPTSVRLFSSGEHPTVALSGPASAGVSDEETAQSGVRARRSRAYASPEQLQSPDGVDLRTDLWRVGVTLHEAVTGTPTFSGDTPGATIRAILVGAPVRACEITPTVPEALQALIDECLRKDPAMRPASARAVADRLRAFLSGDGAASALFRAGETFRITLHGRVFVLVWLASPVVEDVERVVQAAVDARARVGRPLLELVLAPPSLDIGVSQVHAAERMVERFPALARNFDRFCMVIDADGLTFKILQRATELIGKGMKLDAHIGRRRDVLPVVSELEGIPVAELDRLLRI